MSEHMSPIPSMIYNAAVGGHVTNSQQIIDENLNREQNDINQETVGAVPYNSTTPNGMGRIVLKKNDNFKQVVEAQTDGNTIFVIKYDFILTDNVTVPANSVLEFDGGSLNNGSVDFNNCVVLADKNHGCFNNITATGKIISAVYIDWFNGDTKAAFAATTQTIVFGDSKVYYMVEYTIIDNYDTLEIIGNNSTIKCLSNIGTTIIRNINNLYAENIIFDGNNENIALMAINSCKNINLYGCKFINVYNANAERESYGLFIDSNTLETINIQKCEFKNINSPSAIDIASGLIIDNTPNTPNVQVLIKDCIFDYIVVETELINNYVSGKGADGLKIQSVYDDERIWHVVIDSCDFIDCTKGGVKLQLSGVTVSNCKFYNKRIDYYQGGIRVFGSHTKCINNFLWNEGALDGIKVYNEIRSEQYHIEDGEIVFDDLYYCPRDIIICGNHFKYNYQYTSGYCIGFGATNGNICKYSDVIISDNVFDNVKGRAICLDSGFGENFVISNNIIKLLSEDSNCAGVLIYNTEQTITKDGISASANFIFDNISIIGNQIFGDGVFVNSTYTMEKALRGIVLNTTNTKVIISNNIFKDIDVSIFDYFDKNVIITNNMFNNINYGLYYHGVGKTRLSDNTIIDISNDSRIAYPVTGTADPDVIVERNDIWNN